MSSASLATHATGSFPGGVHPRSDKRELAERPIEGLGDLPLVTVPLLQHVGAPCVASGKPRRAVPWGEVIGEVEGGLGAPVHATIAGKLQKARAVTLTNGRHVSALPIKAAGEQPSEDVVRERCLGIGRARAGTEGLTPEAIAEAARAAGLVGLGGAGFPTFVKLRAGPEQELDTLVINGCECEPRLCADDRLMREAPGAVIDGALLAAHALGVERIVLGIEDDKPAAAAALREAASGSRVEIRPLRTHYPQGGEKQLLAALLGRIVPTGGLPLHVGAVVMNVATLAALSSAVRLEQPLTHRVVSVGGAGIVEPRNLCVPIGAPIRALIERCGGLRADAARLVAGGPMMGFALTDLDAVVTKGTSGIIALTAEEVERPAETPCVRCGRCHDVCPLNLVPSRLALAARHRDHEMARRYSITACMECGCCAYVCPAQLPLVQLIRTGKATLPRD